MIASTIRAIIVLKIADGQIGILRIIINAPILFLSLMVKNKLWLIGLVS